MAITITQKVDLVTDTCCVCGVPHAIPADMRDNAYRHGGRWYCPNGHHIGWNKKDCESEADKLRDRVSQLENAVRYEKERLESQKRQTSAVKGQMTKLEKRIANGVCPCCNRSFQNLHRHIKTKHPDFAVVE